VLNWLTMADGFAYTKKAEKQTESTGNVSRLVASSLRDVLHVTMPHNHPADVAAVKALKVKTIMRDQIWDFRAGQDKCWRQVLLFEVPKYCAGRECRFLGGLCPGGKMSGGIMSVHRQVRSVFRCNAVLSISAGVAEGYSSPCGWSLATRET